MSRESLYLILILAVAASCLLEYLGVRLIAASSAATLRRVAGIGAAVWALAFAVVGPHVVLTNLLVLTLALAAGLLLARHIGSIGALSMLLAMAATVDVVSVPSGASRWLTQARHNDAWPVLQFLAVSLKLQSRLVPVIGVTDLMFFTACVSVLRRAGWPEVSSLLVPLLSLLAALAVGLSAGFTPALPFLALGVVAYAYSRRAGSTHQPCRS